VCVCVCVCVYEDSKYHNMKICLENYKPYSLFVRVNSTVNVPGKKTVRP
jgi:hypothetical protein